MLPADSKGWRVNFDDAEEDKIWYWWLGSVSFGRLPTPLFYAGFVDLQRVASGSLRAAVTGSQVPIEGAPVSNAE